MQNRSRVFVRCCQVLAAAVGATVFAAAASSAMAQDATPPVQRPFTPGVPYEPTEPNSAQPAAQAPPANPAPGFPPPPPAYPPGQQPGQGPPPYIEEPQPRTTTQTNDEQLNQLFLFETTPNKSAAGEGYINGQFRFLKYPGPAKTYLYQLQGQGSITDQLAIGGWLPVEDVKDVTANGGSHSGVGDVTFYGQYKLDQLVNHNVVDLTAQADVILPTGSEHEGLGSGHFGVRPLLLAYKAIDAGPGVLGLYGLTGVTISTNADFRLGLAATYDYENAVGVLEFDDITGRKIGGKPFVAFTPGAVYHGLNPWEFALGFPLGVNRGSPDWGIILKVTYAFQR